MRYGSVCSGIEAATVAWEPLGWAPTFFAEIDPFCNAVLGHHYPTVPNHGDFTTMKADDYGAIDILIGGTPCQSFSVAGQRAGLADPRGNLTLEYFALVDRLRPRWVVWENVPGLLSDDAGRTFGTVLGALAECGYGFAYRVLDAQYFGVPQRRRRIFVVGYRGDWRPAAAVLFERGSLSGHSAPGRKAGTDVAASLTRGTDSQGRGGYAGRRYEDDVNLVCGPPSGHTPKGHGMRGANQQEAFSGHLVMAFTANGVGTCGADDNQAQAGHLVFDTTQMTSKENRSCPQPGNPSHPLSNTGHAPALCYSESGPGWWRDGVGTMTHRDGKDGVQTGLLCFTERTRHTGRNLEYLPDQAYALCNPGSGGRTHSRQLFDGMAVRRLTPRECERLQGFPDDYTRIPWRNKPAEQCPDGPRYRALGNSFAVPVVRWIGERMAMCDVILARARVCDEAPLFHAREGT